MFYFSRKEVLVTNDMNLYQSAALALHNEHIDYETKKVRNRGGALGARGHMGSFGEIESLNTMYYIYVRKEDYERALYLIEQVK